MKFSEYRVWFQQNKKMAVDAVKTEAVSDQNR